MTPSLSALKGCARLGCEEPHYASGECEKHYRQTRRNRRSEAQNIGQENGGLNERPRVRDKAKRPKKVPPDLHLYKPFSDLSQVVKVGADVKVAYGHPLAQFVEIIRGRVVSTDFHGAIRIRDKGGRNVFLNPDYVRSTERAPNRSCNHCGEPFFSKQDGALYCRQHRGGQARREAGDRKQPQGKG